MTTATTPRNGASRDVASSTPSTNSTGNGRGDVLVFLPGRARHSRGRRRDPQTQLARAPRSFRSTRASPRANRQRVFRPHGGRRIVLATNVAETSLTVPGVRYVVDTGSRASAATTSRRKVQRLPIETHLASLRQPAAGPLPAARARACASVSTAKRTSRRAPEFTPPEILRTNLAAVILQMAALGLGDVEAISIRRAARATRASATATPRSSSSAPSTKSIALTALGRELARLPVDPAHRPHHPRRARRRCLAEMLVIAAALSVQDPRQRPIDAQREGRSSAPPVPRRRGPISSSFLKLWDAVSRRSGAPVASKLREWCEDGFLSFLRMREWQDVHGQLHHAGAAGWASP